MKVKKNLFYPEGYQCPTKFSLNYVTYGKDSYEIVLTPPQGLQNSSLIFLSQVGHLVGAIIKGYNMWIVSIWLARITLSVCLFLVLWSCNLVTFEVCKYAIATYPYSFRRHAKASLRRQSSCYSFILITSILITWR